MRGTFIRTLVDLAAEDARIVLLVGDLGYTVVEPFAENYPDRFFNVGVAEQNMVGVATGLAESGYIPFLYSIATFASMRGYEFIRNGPLIHNLPVRVIGVGGGFEYGSAGVTHHALEDIAVMRALPGMQVIAPADFEQARTALLETWQDHGPIYYRLGKNNKDCIPDLNGVFNREQAELIRFGKEVLIVSTGSISREAVEAADILQAAGIQAGVALLAPVNPVDNEALATLLGAYKLIVSVEAHSVNGGLGSLLSEVIAEQGLSNRLLRLGVRTLNSGLTGSESYLNKIHGIDADSIARQVIDAVAK
jgi:transketolase